MHCLSCHACFACAGQAGQIDGEEAGGRPADVHVSTAELVRCLSQLDGVGDAKSFLSYRTSSEVGEKLEGRSRRAERWEGQGERERGGEGASRERGEEG